MGYLTFRRMLAYLVASIFIASVAVADSDSLVVSPITAAPTGDIHNGKVVWLDLVTTNPKKAVEFYSTVFGWQSQSFADGDYVELSHRGQVICAVASFEDGQAEEGDARWLISISVDDVDAAAQRVVSNGGAILEPAADLPDRGRFSVIGDSQGAVLMLLRATGGDPADTALAPNEWGWAELWTNDPDSAVSFYEALAGYQSLRVPDADGEDYLVLGTDGRARATIVPLPWDSVEPNWIPYIPVANAANTVLQIIAAGGAVLLRTDASDGTVDVAIVMDPTGGVFGIQQEDFGQ